MANGAAKPHIAEFQVLEALYQEAELMRPVTISSRPVTKRAPTTQAVTEPAESALSDALSLSDDLPIMVRISDLYEEAEAERILADKSHTETSDGEESVNVEEAPTESAPDLSDEFAIPAAFDAPAPASEQEIAPLEDEVTSEDEALIAALTDESDGETDLATSDTLDAMTNDLTAALPDISDMPAAPHEAVPADDSDNDVMIAALAEDIAEPNLDDSSIKGEEEAIASIETAVPSPEAQPVDDNISKQLDDVRQAVEAASATMSGTEDNDAQEHTLEDDSDAILEDEAIRLPEDVAAANEQDTNDEEASLVAGPKLAAFIGETVRDVLEDELPSLVRGLVDEALNERHGRYGGSAPIGLRTKSTRH